MASIDTGQCLVEYGESLGSVILAIGILDYRECWSKRMTRRNVYCSRYGYWAK